MKIIRQMRVVLLAGMVAGSCQSVVDLAKEPITMGPMLTMDPRAEKFVGEKSNWANMLVKRNYREPFVVPDKV